MSFRKALGRKTPSARDFLDAFVRVLYSCSAQRGFVHCTEFMGKPDFRAFREGRVGRFVRRCACSGKMGCKSRMPKKVK